MNRGQIIALIAFVILSLVNGILTHMLMRRRTDLQPGQNPQSGPSRAWQLNVYFYARYDERGRILKAWIVVVTALQFAAAMLVVMLH